MKPLFVYNFSNNENHNCNTRNKSKSMNNQYKLKLYKSMPLYSGRQFFRKINNQNNDLQ